MSQLVDDYLAVSDYNIFSVDWDHFNGDRLLHYPQAAAAVRLVGEHAAKLGQQQPEEQEV